MEKEKIFFEKKLQRDKFQRPLDFKLFLIGIFLLPSAPFFACIILIYPLIKGIFKQKKSILTDVYNFPLILGSIVMILRSIVGTFSYPIDNSAEIWRPELNWIGLTNWIPLFLCFFSFQNYLKTTDQRATVSKVLIASSIPILFSGLSQYFFNLYGPFQIFNGLIIWFQRSPDSLSSYGQGLTSVFSNQNYAGSWLTLIWPFCLSNFLINQKKKNKLKTRVIFCICILFTMCIVLTHSRGAILSLIISLPIVLGKSSIYFLAPIIILIFLTICLNLIPSYELNGFINKIIPNDLFLKLNEMIFNFPKSPRFIIWGNTINFLTQKPFFGWGAATFPILYSYISNLEIYHTHNLFLELSLAYGLVTSILVFSTIIILIINSYSVIFRNQGSKTLGNYAWWTATFIFFVGQMYDVVYYDLRISISSWIMLAALRSIIIEKNSKEI